MLRGFCSLAGVAFVFVVSTSLLNSFERHINSGLVLEPQLAVMRKWSSRFGAVSMVMMGTFVTLSICYAGDAVGVRVSTWVAAILATILIATYVMWPRKNKNG